jgi:hypothetical protein
MEFGEVALAGKQVSAVRNRVSGIAERLVDQVALRFELVHRDAHAVKDVGKDAVSQVGLGVHYRRSWDPGSRLFGPSYDLNEIVVRLLVSAQSALV